MFRIVTGPRETLGEGFGTGVSHGGSITDLQKETVARQTGMMDVVRET